MRAGHAADQASGAVAPPIHLSTIYGRDPDGLPAGGYSYIRESNPTQSLLEDAMAALEMGQSALVFSSGMAAGVAMLSFRMRGGRERALAAVGEVSLFRRATSLGGVESLIEHRASSEGPGTAAPEDLVRLSIGLEHADDLIADLDEALGST